MEQNLLKTLTGIIICYLAFKHLIYAKLKYCKKASSKLSLISLTLIAGISVSTLASCNKSKATEVEQDSPCSGLGNDTCIEKVRLNFENTNKTILGEVNLGNGQFEISFIDRNRTGAYSAQVSTDCNCTITNVQVSTLR